MIRKLIIGLSLSLSVPALAATDVVVHIGDNNSENVSGKFAHAYDSAHDNFYVVQGATYGVDDAQTALSTINSYSPNYVTIDLGKNDVSNYASGQAWIDDLYSLMASIRSANPGVKIAVFTLGPRTGDATYDSRRQSINDTLRADEQNGTGADYLIDLAANPTMSVSSATSDTNLYVSEASIKNFVTCPAECTTSGTKGHAYVYKQYDYAMQAIMASKRPWTVYPIPVTYSSTAVIPSVDPPAYTLAEPADIASTVDLNQWISTTSINSNNIPPGDTPKFRTVISGTHVGRFDPIRAPNISESAHCHSFFGNSTVAFNSTYTSLRNNQAAGVSASAGGPINLTGYWLPCLTKANALGDGIKRVKKLDYVIVYYVGRASIQSQYFRIPRGLRYILGVNMDDPDNTAWKAELNGSVSWISNGWIGWKCDPSTGVQSKYLTNLDGSDALNSCPSTAQIYAEAVSPDCWDGVNLHSPTGYNHMRPEVRNNNTGQGQCPDNWYRIPRLEIKAYFSHQGPSEYINYRLDSDDMASFSGHATRNGESFHTDWFGAWDYPKMLSWLNNCTGAHTTISDSFTAHECDSSTFNTTQRFIGGFAGENAPDGSRTPQVTLGARNYGSVSSHYFDYPPETPVTPPPPGRHSGKVRFRIRHHFFDED